MEEEGSAKDLRTSQMLVSRAGQPQLLIPKAQFTAEKFRWGWDKRHGTSVGPRLLTSSLVV